MRPNRNAAVALTLLVWTLLAVACSQTDKRAEPQEIKVPTEYSAVLLSGGQVYYGKLEKLGTPFPVLRNVYYVQTVMSPETKQPSNILVRRGKEWHGPDQMLLNANHIILVEPVSPSSKVAQLIAEQEKQGASPAPQ